jgi:hypothetical protein
MHTLRGVLVSMLAAGAAFAQPASSPTRAPE